MHFNYVLKESRNFTNKPEKYKSFSSLVFGKAFSLSTSNWVLESSIWDFQYFPLNEVNDFSPHFIILMALAATCLIGHFTWKTPSINVAYQRNKKRIRIKWFCQNRNFFQRFSHIWKIRNRCHKSATGYKVAAESPKTAKKSQKLYVCS